MVIDTSIFIEHLRAKEKKRTQLYLLPDNKEVFISAVTYYELLMGATNEEKMQDVRNLTFGLPVLSFNAGIAEEAGRIYHQLRRQNRMIEFRDIFIGATCIVNDLPLLTNNTKHFQRIEGVKIQKTIE